MRAKRWIKQSKTNKGNQVIECDERHKQNVTDTNSKSLFRCGQ